MGGRKSKRVLFMGDVRVREYCLWGRKSKRILFMGDVRVIEYCLWGA